MAHASPAKKAKSPKKRTPKKLGKMKANPKDDWKIADVVQVATALDMQVDKPSSGSHYSVFSPYMLGALTVPRAKPIKPIYIKQFVKLCEGHIIAKDEAAQND